MRSVYITEFRRSISELNNNFSHYIFVWEQFRLDNRAIIAANGNILTTVAYSNNANSAQFNVKLERLEQSNDSTYDFILISLFRLLYSNYEVYLRELYEFARKTDTHLPQLQSGDSIPDAIFRHLAIDANAQLAQEEIDTCNYLRLRRNGLTHRGGEVSGLLTNYINQRGNRIQTYWVGQLTNGLFGLDFHSYQTETFTKEEIFDIINIFRKLTTKFDSLICNRLGANRICSALQEVFSIRHADDIGRWGSVRTISKFRKYCKIEFDVEPDASHIAMFDD